MGATIGADTLVVFALIGVTIVLFVTELLPNDTTAIAVIVALVVLEPWTHIDPNEAISGFANPATITIVAMFILSGGIERTGIVSIISRRVSERTIGHPRRLLASTIGIAGPTAGLINNTPVVAILIPMVTDLADRNHVSPSKLLIPLSYAAMLGGTLTLIGTSTNILASDLSRELIGRPFTMFEFTHLGVIVLIVGSVYLLTIGQWLLPERIKAIDLTEEFKMRPYLGRVVVQKDSPIVDHTIEEAFADSDLDIDVLQIVRAGGVYVAPGSDQTLRAGDRLTLRGDEDSRDKFIDQFDLRRFPRAPITEGELDRPDGRGRLVEAVVRSGSALIGHSIDESGFRDHYRGTILAVRRGTEIQHENLNSLELSEGNGLLIHATRSTLEALSDTSDLLITESTGPGDESLKVDEIDRRKISLAVGILISVIFLAAIGWLPIVISALAGVVAMIVGNVITPRQAYRSVSWEVIFLLAGVIPLGLALQQSGGDAVIAELLVGSASFLPIIYVLGLFYLATGLLANMITPVASIVLMLPVAVDAASRIGGNAFAFVLAVTFAASTAFMTPVGYQTNLMVYSPGGYHFSDFLRVGAPLQLILAVVTTLGIWVFWGLC